MPGTTYLVRGMTCDHCRHAVVTEISRLRGVTEVDVDLDGGRVTVVSEGPLDEPAVREAVDEAGYTLVGVTS